MEKQNKQTKKQEIQFVLMATWALLPLVVKAVPNQKQQLTAEPKPWSDFEYTVQGWWLIVGLNKHEATLNSDNTSGAVQIQQA